MIVWGLIVLTTAVPLFWYGTRQANDSTHREKTNKTVPDLTAVQILKMPLFWFLGLGYAMMALDHTMLINHIFPLLDEYQI